MRILAMKNIKFLYLYRDGGNYKSRAEVVFSNPAGRSPTSITEEIQGAFMQDGLFIAHQVRVPEAFPYLYEELTVDDHCFHEFDSVEITTDAPNDRYGRAISEFLTEVTRESLAGWHAFDPYDRLHSPDYVPQSRGRE
jgi:hypothetical protein